MSPLSCIEINKVALQNNLKQFRQLLSKDNKLVAVVKANAYGHGLEQVVSIANDFVDYFQVDDFQELKSIKSFTSKPVFVFGYVGHDELEQAASLEAIFGVYDIERILRLNEIGEKHGRKIEVHLKVDALLGRQGILIGELEKFLQELKKLRHICLGAIYSHFSNIEDVDNLQHANLQYEALLKAKEILRINGFNDVSHHISATSGFLTNQKSNWGSSLLRLGIGMYGLWPSKQIEESFAKDLLLQPALRWVTKVAQVKTVSSGFPIGYGITYRIINETKIAVIPQGYSDGYDRGLSNKGEVLVRGKRCPILGRVAMNMFVIDVSHLSEVKADDEVVLIGFQGEEIISAEELANKVGTINYEIIARVSSLLPRVIT